MSPEAAAIWSGTLSGAICGLLAIVGAIWAVLKGFRDLEETEIRRQRVECITSLYGVRFALGDRSRGFSPQPEDVSRFNFEINRAGGLFAEDRNVLNGLRDLHEDIRAGRSDAMDRLTGVIKYMARNTRLKIDNLSDADVRNLITMNAPVQFIPIGVPGNPPAPQQAPPVQPQTPPVTGPGFQRA